MKIKILKGHPRAHSLRIRELLIDGNEDGVVATAGLIAQGRGEAFDYLIGEKTIPSAKKAIVATAALLLTARHPVISVNGNVAALVAKYIAELTKITKVKVEANLFYRSAERENTIKMLLQKYGIKEVLGTDISFQVQIPEIMSDRRRVDSRGIYLADLVLVPLEDGDRTEALANLGKKVVAIDLNPLSRTAQKATVTIVDNITRVMPLLINQIHKLKTHPKPYWHKIINDYDNRTTLNETISYINKRLINLAARTT